MSKCKTIYFDYTLVLVYSIVSQKSFSITPWSFEDHFIWTQLLHLVAFVFIPLRFYKKAGVSPHQVYRYAFGFLIVHAVSQFISSLFLMPTCSFWYGLRWYFLLEAPSLFLLTSLSLFLIQHCSRRRYIYLWLICFVTFFGLFIVYDLLETPTLFFFHPSIGYYPGPLYDHWIPIPRSLIFASLWSVVAGIFFYMWTRKRQIGFLGFILLLPLLIRSTLGLHQTHQTVQSALPSHYTTQFTQVFSDQALRSSQLQSMDYYIQRISKTIALPLPTNPIKIYIYSDPRQKKRLTGTHLTMIGNPRQRSLHILDFSTWDLLFVHELTHALSSPLRQNILSMPLNPLLTEGLAMYTQKYMGPYNLQQWGKAIVRFRKQTTLANIDQISFYRQPPLHAYGLAGAWTDYLIQTYGIDRYKKYYGGQPFSNVYPSPQHEVEKQWFAWMDQAVLTEEIYNTMLSSLERKSVFEVKCPTKLRMLCIKSSSATTSSRQRILGSICERMF
ncbi:MAG: hypothetical protein R3A45_06955 [Bdellovibrionota bacterium]